MKSANILAVLLLIFVTLKLCGLIAWPWVWVLLPLWLPLVPLAVLIVLTVALSLLK